MRSKQPFDIDADRKKDHILATAELLFAEKGHDQTSLRELTTLANVNLAAVNYHFGSKDGLINAVFDRLSHRVNLGRIQELKGYLKEKVDGRAQPELEDIIAIFTRPYLGGGVNHQGTLLARLILQHRLSPSDLTKRIIKKHFDPMAKMFIDALKAVCPGVDAAELYWRYTFMVSAVVLTVTSGAGDSRLSRLSGGLLDVKDREFLRQALMRFLAGGFLAPSP